MENNNNSFAKEEQAMWRTILRFGMGIMIGIGISTIIFFTLIWLGYSEAQATGQSITFAGIEIYRITNGNEIANNANMTWLGIVITGSWIIVVEICRSLRMKRRLKSAV